MSCDIWMSLSGTLKLGSERRFWLEMLNCRFDLLLVSLLKKRPQKTKLFSSNFLIIWSNDPFTKNIPFLFNISQLLIHLAYVLESLYFLIFCDKATKKSDLVKKKNDVVLQLPKKNNDEKKMSNTSKPRCLFDSLICSKFSENGAIMGKSLVQKRGKPNQDRTLANMKKISE